MVVTHGRGCPRVQRHYYVDTLNTKPIYCNVNVLQYQETTVIWFIFVLKIISVFNLGGDLISFL